MLLSKIPAEFYRLFRTKNREYYIMILLNLYHQNMEQYHSFGLTTGQCRDIINETIATTQIEWLDDQEEGEESGETTSPSSISLSRLLDWGWLMKDYDEQSNEDVITFPEYSQLFVELFEKLTKEEDALERESMLSIYSLLYTYHMDKDHNNEILKNAWNTSKRLVQLLANMQDGMRTYFDKLSVQKNFIGIQEILVQELNNSDSRKYAILTTTDSFYRYKEQVKELISEIINDTESLKYELVREQMNTEPESTRARTIEFSLDSCEETMEYMMRIEREFDRLEKKYNQLIEQKSIFAKRALARIRYILQEGVQEGEGIVKLINLINQREEGEEILSEISKKMVLTDSFYQINANSLYQRRVSTEREFIPEKIQVTPQKDSLSDFVPKPLYSKQEIDSFRQRLSKDGQFIVQKDSITSVEDMEKLMILWQQVTENMETEEEIVLGEEFENEQGFRFRQLILK